MHKNFLEIIIETEGATDPIATLRKQLRDVIRSVSAEAYIGFSDDADEDQQVVVFGVARDVLDKIEMALTRQRKFLPIAAMARKADGLPPKNL